MSSHCGAYSHGCKNKLRVLGVIFPIKNKSPFLWFCPTLRLVMQTSCMNFVHSGPCMPRPSLLLLHVAFAHYSAEIQKLLQQNAFLSDWCYTQWKRFFREDSAV